MLEKNLKMDMSAIKQTDSTLQQFYSSATCMVHKRRWKLLVVADEDESNVKNTKQFIPLHSTFQHMYCTTSKSCFMNPFCVMGEKQTCSNHKTELELLESLDISSWLATQVVQIRTIEGLRKSFSAQLVRDSIYRHRQFTATSCRFQSGCPWSWHGTYI